MGPRNHVLDSLDTQGKGQCLGVVPPLKSLGSFAAVQKRLNRSRCHLGLTQVRTSNRVLHGAQGRTNPFAAIRGDKLAMRPFVIIFCPLISTAHTP